MFGRRKKELEALQGKCESQQGVLDALDKVMATIEFDLNGNILTANDNFLNTLGYSLNEVQGMHHSLFVTAEYKASSEYARFWQRLNQGEFIADKFMRLGKGNKEVWIQASYNPIRDGQGNITKVIKFATDITAEALLNAGSAGQLAAIDKVMATIEFELSGKIITANANFLNVLNYSLSEIQGQHHSLFVAPKYKSSAEYAQFWQKLNQGEFIADQFLRIGKGGQEVWIQASYNPIRDAAGRVYKVVKFATDITAQKLEAFALESMMTEAKQVLEKVAQQDLSSEVTGEYQGELAELKEAINSTVSNLRTIVVDIQEGSAVIGDRSGEVSDGNTTLSQRTQEQAAALEETAASIEEMSGTVQQNADNARQADELAISTRDQAKAGEEVVEQAIKAMTAITSSSNKINDIIGVIDEIAFQTNLLALNAAVEAARAGEQGRGFAVVASEVRTLAGRSAEAAKEIKALISTSVESVSDGSRLVSQSGSSLHEIVQSVQKVAEIIAEISAAGAEQALGIEQINTAVSSMDSAVQQNAALVEETSAASESLSEQAMNMREMVRVFKLEA